MEKKLYVIQFLKISFYILSINYKPYLNETTKYNYITKMKDTSFKIYFGDRHSIQFINLLRILKCMC